MKFVYGLLGILILSSIGCNSIKTTPLDRSESGRLTPNPSVPLQGVPVMLKVPTHIDVEIIQVDYWRPNSKTNLLEIMTVNGGAFANRHVQTELVKTEQMFVVDPKRPGAGMGVYGFGFRNGAEDNGKGHLSSINYQSQDSTLESSAALFRQIAAVAGQSTSAEADANGDQMVDGAEQNQVELRASGVISTRRTIAFRRFKLNAPGVEAEVKAFVGNYMNNCHGGCSVGSLTYPN